MKPNWYFHLSASLLLLGLVGAYGHLHGQTPTDKTASYDARIDAVFLAQTHVMKPDQPYFKLTGNRAALLKAHVISPSGAPAPEGTPG